jgi:DNA-binding MarR family transcriptional regulator
MRNNPLALSKLSDVWRLEGSNRGPIRKGAIVSFEKAVAALASYGHEDANIRQLRILTAIHKGNGEPPRTVRGIAKWLGMPKSAVTRGCDRFERCNPPLITRVLDEKDSRSVVLGLTLAGKDLVRRLLA